MDAQTATLPRECKHALYFNPPQVHGRDLVLIKEVIHHPDGRRTRQLRQVKKFVRDFYVTRDGWRNHRDKKEWEQMNRLQKFTCAQHQLSRRISQATGYGNPGMDLRMLARSPYLYGVDITPAALAKAHYQRHWPDAISPNLVAMLDIETDVLGGSEEPIMVSLTMQKQWLLVVVRSFFPEHSPQQAEALIRASVQEHLGSLMSQRQAELTIVWADNGGHAAKIAIEHAHQWQPDFLAIWNMNFDIPKMCEAMMAHGYDLPTVWTDPAVDPAFRFFKYHEGSDKKVTSSGKVTPKHPAERWHTVETPASFYVIDAMCTYLQLRVAAGKEVSYSLDYILDKHLKRTKLKFDPVPGKKIVGLRWHQEMQRNHKAVYCAYNLFDSVGMELLDEKTTDLSSSISLMSGCSEYRYLNSQPKRTCDDLHFFCLKRGWVIGSTSNKMEDDFDEITVDLKRWIVTLPADLVADTGLRVLEELPAVASNMRTEVADLDLSGTYPTLERIMNISKQTTASEVVQIQGLTDSGRRAFGINLSGGNVNAVELCCQAFRAPTLDTLLTAFKESLPPTRAKPQVAKALEATQDDSLGLPEGTEPFSELNGNARVVDDDYLEL